jgi:hypothetical protein
MLENTSSLLFVILNGLKKILRYSGLLNCSPDAATVRFYSNNGVYIPLDGTELSRENRGHAGRERPNSKAPEIDCIESYEIAAVLKKNVKYQEKTDPAKTALLTKINVG